MTNPPPATNKLTPGLITTWLFSLFLILCSFGSLFSMGFMEAFFIFIMGLVLLPPFNTFLHQKFNITLAGPAKTGIILVSFIISTIIYSQSPEGKQVAQEQAAQQKIDDQNTQKAQLATFSQFESQISVIEIPCSNALKIVQDLITANSNLIDIYGSAKSAKLVCDGAARDLYGLSAPDDLPDDIKDKLSKTVDSLAIAQSYKADAMESFMRYVDERKVSHMQELKEKSESAQALGSSAASDIASLKVTLENPDQ